MDEKRFNDLYNRSFSKGIKLFSDFLNLDEQSILSATYLPCTVYGGYDGAERVAAGFGEDISEDDFPFVYISVKPLSAKFSEKLTHRDYLGALMNLGIKREMLGDILISENSACIICLDKVADYVADNLTRIRHTSVKSSKTDSLPENTVKPPEPSELVVSSLRLDVLVCAVYKLSRKEGSKLFSAGKIFVNGRLTENPSYTVKEGDIISVRGTGRFAYDKPVRSTKKDRIVIEIRKYC